MGKYVTKPVQVDAMRADGTKDFEKFIRDLGGWLEFYGHFVTVKFSDISYKVEIGSWFIVWDRNVSKVRVLKDESFKRMFEKTNTVDKIDWDQIAEFFKSITSKNIKTVNAKAKRHIKARLKEGHTIDDLKKAITNCFNDDYHQSNNHKYLTLEFISRPDKFERFLLDQNTGNKNDNYTNPLKGLKGL